MHREIIAERENVAAILQDFGGSQIVVTFNDAQANKNGTNFWADGLLTKAGISAVGIVTSAPLWYPPVETGEIISKVRERIGGRRVFTFGFSQGAYAALKFSKRLGASAALAFSPQWSIDPSDVASFDRRYTHHYLSDIRNGQRIEAEDLSENSFCIVDPFELPDLQNVRQMQGYSRLTRVVSPFCWHGTIVMVAQAGGGVSLLRYLLGASPPTAQGIRSQLRTCRKKSNLYFSTARSLLVARIASRQRYLPSTLFFARINGRCEAHREFMHAVVQCFIDPSDSTKTALDAQIRSEAFRGLVDVDLESTLLACLRVRLSHPAITMAQEICKNTPEHTRGRLRAIWTLAHYGNTDMAREELDSLARYNHDAFDWIADILRLSTALQFSAPLERLAGTPGSVTSLVTQMYVDQFHSQVKQTRQSGG